MSFFRDKDCHDFSFEDLPIVTVEPIVIPENPSDSPSISVSPSTKPSVSVVPSASPTLSQTPSSKPSMSMTPSHKPSAPIGKGGKGGKGSNSWSYSYKSPTNGGRRTRVLNAHKNRRN